MKKFAFQVDRDHPVPIYYQLACQIKDGLQKGMLTSGTRLPTEWALADQVGINRLTARQCYQMLEREGIIRRYRSKGTFIAPRDRGGKLLTRRNVIFLTFVKELDGYFGRVAKGIESGLSKRGINLILQLAPENEALKIREILRMRPDGLIWSFWDFDKAPEMIRAIRRSGLPLALVDGLVDRMRADYVGIDMAWGTAQLVKRLVKRGCRRIRLVYFAHRHFKMEMAGHVRAFRRAVASAGLSRSAGAVNAHILSMKKGANPGPILDALAHDHKAYDAVILHTVFADPLDYAGYLWAGHAKVLRHKKIGLMLSDAHSLASIAGLPIVPVMRRDMAMGQKAAELIAARIDQKGTRQPEHILIKD